MCITIVNHVVPTLTPSLLHPLLHLRHPLQESNNKNLAYELRPQHPLTRSHLHDTHHHLQDSNDNRPIFDSARYTVNIVEQLNPLAKQGVHILTLTSSDLDSHKAVTYSLLHEDSRFDLDPDKLAQKLLDAKKLMKSK